MLHKKITIANTLKSNYTLVRNRVAKIFKKACVSTKKNALVAWVGTNFIYKHIWFILRIAIIAFFIGLNIVLGKAFFAQNKIGIPFPVASVLLRFGIIPSDNRVLEQLANPYKKEIALEADDIISEINIVRSEHDLPEFTANAQLASAAGALLDEVAAHNYDLQAKGDYTSLADALNAVKYRYSWVHHNALVGPLSPGAVVTAWLSDAAQSKALLTPEFTEIGLAVKVVDTSFMGKAGVIVQLLAQPQTLVTPANSKSQQEVQVSKPKKLIEFDDLEVVKVLNEYRSTHKVAALNINNHLCVYAEKRVQDLLEHGGLDGHAGFLADFDAEESPIGIRSYQGSTIGENLASQYCVNGTTGETIFAEHPTQLIEWCFDSSQKGHREAQLSPNYRDVCVRHGNNMYVVIFGDP